MIDTVDFCTMFQRTYTIAGVGVWFLREVHHLHIDEGGGIFIDMINCLTNERIRVFQGSELDKLFERII